MATFLLIRHATHGLLTTRFVARTSGVHLNEQGLREAESLIARLEGVPIEAIYSSPLERALETAQPLAKHLGLDVEVREGLNEVDLGEWTNLTFDELHAKPDWQQWRDNRSNFCPPGGEYPLETQARMIRVLEELRRKHSGVVAVFSHGDPVKSTLAHYLGVHLDLFRRIHVDPASISIVEVTDAAPIVIRVNDTGPISLG
jgi:probable phosphomutase (TIGR03848 family)